MSELWAKIVSKIFRVRWIVNGGGEMGVRVAGANLYYYKYDMPIIYDATSECSGWRPVFKREFGECVMSRYPENEWPTRAASSPQEPQP